MFQPTPTTEVVSGADIVDGIPVVDDVSTHADHRSGQRPNVKVQAFGSGKFQPTPTTEVVSGSTAPSPFDGSEKRSPFANLRPGRGVEFRAWPQPCGFS